jgi:predicted ATP-dependent protease
MHCKPIGFANQTRYCGYRYSGQSAYIHTTTGSVNQRGEIQPIGGTNYKIEGFFDVCKAKGLTGTQGVMIPWLNVRNLMLKKEVVQAVEEGKFHVWSVAHIDEGIERLTGVKAGKKVEGKDEFEEGSVHQLVKLRLAELSSKSVKAKPKSPVSKL